MAMATTTDHQRDHQVQFELSDGKAVACHLHGHDDHVAWSNENCNIHHSHDHSGSDHDQNARTEDLAIIMDLHTSNIEVLDHDDHKKEHDLEDKCDATLDQKSPVLDVDSIVSNTTENETDKPGIIVDNALVIMDLHKSNIEVQDHDDDKKEHDLEDKCDATMDHKSPVLDVVVIVNNTTENEKDKPGIIVDNALVDDKERCRGFYSNRQKILLVGEGDFSFASCLATAFGTASNIVATSLDTRDKVIESYTQGELNLLDLEKRGAIVVHQVDVHTMDKHPQLQHKLFDRIVFNFPHAGGIYFSVRECDSWYIECHKLVVGGFFKAARNMVTEDGEIHVTHKTTHPYDRWNVVELAEEAGLVLKGEAKFYRWDYPGYVNKKAYGSSWDSTFPVGECSTFMFS